MRKEAARTFSPPGPFPAVPRRPREIELSVERPLGPEGSSGGVARLTARFELGPDGEAPGPSELAKTLEDLKADLDALVGPPIALAPVARPDRELKELVNAYRPRQRELVDLLRDEGEITPGEHAVLVQHLSATAEATTGPRSTAPPPERLSDRTIAAMPIAADRSPGTARSVSEILERYQISSLRQAGAVRARRQISFAEYMALKRYFQERESTGTAA